MTILALTQPQDLQALAVREALRHKGSDVRLWMTTDLAQLQRATIEINQDFDAHWSVTGAGVELGSEPIDVVWHPHPELPVVTPALHPADRRFASFEYEEFYRWLTALLAEQAFWINPLEAGRRAQSKALQQRAAVAAGLATPKSLYSNDPQKISAFLRDQGGKIVYKPFLMHGPWITRDLACACLYTSLITEDTLPDDEILQATPGIYQELLAKACDLRITVIGERVFPARLDSQATRDGRIDWRRSHGDVACEMTEIPAELKRAILELMRRLGLVFGCLDFVLTPRGDYYFLEVNETGQFAFVERSTGFPLLDAFCEMLIQAKPDYRWDPERAEVGFRDVEERVLAIKDRVAAEHVLAPAQRAGYELEPEKLRALQDDAWTSGS